MLRNIHRVLAIIGRKEPRSLRNLETSVLALPGTKTPIRPQMILAFFFIRFTSAFETLASCNSLLVQSGNCLAKKNCTDKKVWKNLNECTRRITKSCYSKNGKEERRRTRERGWRIRVSPWLIFHRHSWRTILIFHRHSWRMVFPHSHHPLCCILTSSFTSSKKFENYLQSFLQFYFFTQSRTNMFSCLPPCLSSCRLRRPRHPS